MPDEARLTEMRSFKYEAPVADKPRKTVWLARTDRLIAAIQNITKGGEAALHAHTHLDGFWFVLKGHARFYSDHKEVFAELGPHEGVLVPRGVKYWFEQVGEEPLQLMQIEASDVSMSTDKAFRSDMVRLAPPVQRSEPTEYIDAKPVGAK